MTDESIPGPLAVGLACARACLRCADACRGHAEFSACERACRDCFTACVLWLADLREGNRWLFFSSVACTLACDVCAMKCEHYQGESFRECVTACHDCAGECRKVAARPHAFRPETTLWEPVDRNTARRSGPGRTR
jgi:hypothetical protein